MPVAAISSPAPEPSHPPILTTGPDGDFEQRWNAWKARGQAREVIVRHRFIAAAVVTGGIAMAAAIGYVVLF